MLQIIDTSFDVVVDGKAVKTYNHEGKQFFCAEPGKKFTLRFRTPKNKRILAIVSVDGLNILTGKKASRDDAQGYVIDEGGGTVDGWRTSNEKVAEFVFSSKEGSYSVKGGEGTQTGVIACAFYAEKEKPQPVYNPPIVITQCCCQGHCKCNKPYQPHWYGVTTPNTNPGYTLTYSVGAGATMDLGGTVNTACTSGLQDAPRKKMNLLRSVGSLGTAFGEEKESVVTSTAFERGEKLYEQVEYYDTRENLRAMGVPTDDLPKDLPSGFPEDDSRYCKPPKK